MDSNSTQSTRNKNRNVTAEKPQQPGRNNQNKNRNRNRNRNRNKNIVRDIPAHVNEQREQEIKQCENVLGNRQFKLFKTGKYVSSYGFIPSNKGKSSVVPGVKYMINIPYDYPKSPVKLVTNINTNDGEQTKTYTGQQVAQISNLIKNFNAVARQQPFSQEPILAQLNYLIQQQQELANNQTREFNNVTHLKHSFYSQFTSS